MTTAGWIFMLCSLTLVVGLNVFCFRRVLRSPHPDEEVRHARESDPL